MILASVNLLNNTADTRTIVTNDDEEVLSDKTHFFVCCHYLYMRKSLPVRTDLVLAFDNEHTPVS